MPVFNYDGNKIEILEAISRGSYGTVFKGIFNDVLPVAIKKQKRDTKAAKVEWENLTLISSEFIVKGIFCFYERSNMYMVMEKADANLYEYVEKRGAIVDRKLFAAIASQIIKAVSVVHKMGLIHRDIKPLNILIFGNTFKLCDFGLSIENQKGLTTRTGTNANMAPEVIIEKEYDTSCDIWSVGTLLYYMRIGYKPFRTARNDVNITLLDMVQKIEFDGIIEGKVRQFLGERNITYTKEPKIFDGKSVYYRHKSLILNCLQADATKRPTADALLQHLTFLDLCEKDFDMIPRYRPPTAW